MATSPQEQYHTAKAMSIKKFDNPTPRAISSACRSWRTHDQASRVVTRTKLKATPSDRTTPPRSPRVPGPNSTPRQYSPQVAVSPCQFTPPSVERFVPRLTLRQRRNVTQTEPLKVQTCNTSPYSFSAGAAKMNEEEQRHHRSTPVEHVPAESGEKDPRMAITPANTLFPIVTPATGTAGKARFVAAAIKSEAYKGATSRGTQETAMKDSAGQTMKTTTKPTTKATSMPHMATKTTTTGATKKSEHESKVFNPFGDDQPVSVKPYKVHIIKRRASEVFNMSFSFAAPSRRRVRDRTPQISPRTSFSSGSDDSTDKRKRVDSSDTPSSLFNWLGPLISRSTTASKDTNHAQVFANDDDQTFLDPASPRQDQRLEDLSNYPFIHTTTDAHPGHPVDFSTQTRDDEIFGSTTAPDEPEAESCQTYTEAHPGQPVHFGSLECDSGFLSSDTTPYKPESESYHTYLSETLRRASLLTPTPLSPTTPVTKARDNRLSKEARILGLTSDAPSRKNTYSRTPRKSVTSSNVSMASGRTGSSASDPSSERFLTHVRASLEARARKRSERQKSVFRGERETGWFTLGEGPL